MLVNNFFLNWNLSSLWLCLRDIERNLNCGEKIMAAPNPPHAFVLSIFGHLLPDYSTSLIRWLEIFWIFKTPSNLGIKKDNLYFPATYIIFVLLPTVPKSIWILEIPSLTSIFLLQRIILHLQNSFLCCKQQESCLGFDL